jgi:hypothetical protein
MKYTKKTERARKRPHFANLFANKLRQKNGSEIIKLKKEK